MASLRYMCALHSNLGGKISVVKDFFRYKNQVGPDDFYTTGSVVSLEKLPGKISLLQQMKLLSNKSVVHLHIKIVYDIWLIGRTGLDSSLPLPTSIPDPTNPPKPTIDEMVFLMRKAYGNHGFGVVIQSIERLDLPPNFYDIDIDSDECDDLFENNKNSVKENEVVVFFVASLIPSKNGVHPGGIDGAIVSLVASPWTLGHEVAHALDLDHVDSGCKISQGTCKLDRLMTGAGTWKINVPLPKLISDEIDTMIDSDLTLTV
jgi:hypothetical protein